MTKEQLEGLKQTAATLTAQVSALEEVVAAPAPVDATPTKPVEATPAPVVPAPAEGEVPTLTVSQANKMVADAVVKKDEEIAALKKSFNEKLAALEAKYAELMVVENNAETGFAALLKEAQAM